MLQSVNVQVLMTLVAYEVMPVPFMVTHKEILAMSRLDVLPTR